MPVICNGTATATGNSGLMASVDAVTRRTDPYPDDSHPEPTFLVRVTGTADASALEALFARRTRIQRVGWRIWLGGALSGGGITGGVRVDNDVTGVQITRQINEPIQTASITVPHDSLGRTAFGSPLALGAPVPGLTSVHFWLAYKLPEDAENRYREYPVMLYALADASPRTIGPPSSDQLTFRSALARYVDTPMTYRLPAGHGYKYGGAIQGLCNRFPDGVVAVPSLPQYTPNVPQSIPGVPVNFGDFPQDVPLRKAIELVKGDWLSLVRAIGNVFGAKLYDSEAGGLTACLVTPERGVPAPRRPGDPEGALVERIEGVIGPRDLVVGVNGQRIPRATITPSVGGVTKITLTGQAQVLRDTGSPHKVLNLSFKSTANRELGLAAFFQDGSGAVTATGDTPSAADRIVTKGTTTIEKNGQTVVSSLTETMSLTNPTKARYTLDTDLSILTYLPVFIDENSVDAQARQFRSERLILSARSGFSKSYDPTTKRLTGTVKETYGFKHVRRYLQHRSARTTGWDDLVGAPGQSGRFSLGTGEGVKTINAEFQLTDRVLEVYNNTADGFVASKRTSTYGFALRTGWQYRYGDGTESRDAEETFGLVSQQDETWQKIDEFTVAYHSETRDSDGRLIAGEDDVLEISAWPQAEKLDDATPQRSDFGSDLEFSMAVAASHFEQQPMTATVSGPAATRVYKEATYSDPWAQYPYQLQRMGQRAILMASASVVTWTVLPNPLIREGSWWHVRDGGEIDHDVIVTGKQIAPSGGALIQNMTGLTWD